ncbi:MAG: metal ABC transporter permease [Verrucomicrobiota bacterium]
MEWYVIDTWIVVIGVLASVSCALLGNFLVLRKMSMMGDAISHAVLPGLAIAFLFTGARTSFSMFVGAAIVGLLTAVFTHWISRFGNVDQGASMGIVFTTLFAFGLLLIVQAADHVDLDPGCVLYGAIELTPLDVVWRPEVFSLSLGVPRAALVLGGVLLLNTSFVLLFFKELRISSFDPELATTTGINANLMHYLLMIFVAITTVAAFEVVGSIIVIAMLIVPAAAAHLLTDRLGVMVVISAILGALAAIFGHLSALLVPGWFGYESTSTSGMTAVVAGLIFTAVLFCAPRHGVLIRLKRAYGKTPRIS